MVYIPWTIDCQVLPFDCIGQGLTDNDYVVDGYTRDDYAGEDYNEDDYSFASWRLGCSSLCCKCFKNNVL